MKSILFLGPVPPPYMGPSIATNVILCSKLKDEFNLIHCDTSDHRDLNKLNVIDFDNIYLAVKQYLLLFWLILKWWPRMVYIPISQTTVGYFRDAFFILISKLFGRKVICHLRGGNFKNWFHSTTLITRWLVRRIHSLVDGQIVLGENLKYLFYGLIPEERIFVVPNGKDIELDFKDRNESAKIKILFLSNFIQEKGVLDVLRSVPDVCKHSNKGVEFLFAGNWRDELTKQLFQDFIKKNPDMPIIIKGPIFGKKKYELFILSDIFVFPSYYPAEGHPWVIVEAMAAGLPIITTNQGAIIESVRDGVNGFIIEKKNPEQIARKIKILIDDPKLRKKMEAESRKLYMENFTEDKMIEKMTLVFNTVLER